MDQGTAAIFGAFIGGSVAIGSNLVLESYKRHRDCQGTASALAGEIAALLELAKIRNYVNWLSGLADRFDKGEDVPFPAILADERRGLDPVVRAHLDRFGHLPDDLPERVVLFHSYLLGIKTDLLRLTAGEFKGRPKAAAGILREDLELWAKTAVPLGHQLVSDLRAVVHKRWLGIF